MRGVNSTRLMVVACVAEGEAAKPRRRGMLPYRSERFAAEHVEHRFHPRARAHRRTGGNPARSQRAAHLRIGRARPAARDARLRGACPARQTKFSRSCGLCHAHKIPFVARGHGTGLSGGALPLPDGVLIGLSRLNRIIDVDIPNQRITVEPGVINLDVTRRVAPDGYYYAPDPSSQLICSIGGNVAENSGGAHCLKYGFTVHHVLGVEAVLPNGEMVHLGGSALDAPGIDLLGALVGSEGTLAVVTKVTLRILRVPEAVKTILAAFESTEAAGDRRVRDHRRRHHSRRGRNDGQAHDRSGRGGRPSEFSARRSGAHRGAGRHAVRGRRALPARRSDLPAHRRHRNPDCPQQRRARAHLEGPQGGVRGNGTRFAELLRAGRRDSAHEARRSAWTDSRARSSGRG